ncbi:MAG TPA: protein-export chaperone SecB [Opitutaceae bacterium]|nr:protein-export chaperone SecB [Opitutaceae bacterium]
MKPSVLQLERAFFRRVEVNAQLGGAPSKNQDIATTVSSGRAADNPLRFQVTLIVQLLDSAEKHAGYHGSVEVMGYFTLSDAVPEKDRDRTVVVHGCTLLFGMVREMVCAVTARGPWPMLTLPTMSFHDLVPMPAPPPASVNAPLAAS